MKLILMIILLAFFAIPSLASAGVISPARVRLTDGEVMFRTPDSEEWLAASVNTPLDEGDAIWAPAGSRTEVQLADGTVVRLDGETQLDLIAVEDNFTHLHLAIGKLYLKTPPSARKDSLQIDADDTTILPDARTRLRVDMLPNSQEDVAIFKGSAYVEGNGSRTKVRAGEHIALEEEHSELLPLNAPDSWEIWNSERDRNQSRTTTADSNLPDELQTYSGELDANGRWVSVPEYGMVWRPTVVLSNDWAPYRSGRWIWKGDDYVWISYENWGWAPYHYGRWAIVSGFGWCWVPPVRGDIYWGPGYVGWYRTGNHVGWTPLAPGETFYGRRHYGRHSVNVTDTPVNSASVYYKNRNARGGFSILLQNDFLRGRTVFQTPSAATSVSVAVSLGSPRIQPLRETRMPVIRQTPPRVTPPAIIRHDNRDLRSRFPRIAPPTAEKRRPVQPPAVMAAPPTPTATPRPTIPAPSRSRQTDDGRTRTAPPHTDTNRPARTEQPSETYRNDKHAPPVSQRQSETARQEKRPKEREQRKVWNVTTTDQGNDRKVRERDGKERKGRD
ncbi:MAG: FecR domain-containing protein [Desulfuromonadaceae bacterium]|nr:FecR domain-containing protein [Desulfuromonadaceae bacterium]